MIDFTAAIERESLLFLDAMPMGEWSSPVPSCPDWDLSDLAWHLTEVQHFWGSIVADGLDDPSRVLPLARPADDGLLPLLAAESDALIAALRSRGPDDPCWSWYSKGRNVGWVMRRQAHEALIHRFDAQLAVGMVTAMNEELSADGIDEILRVMIDASDIPDWSAYLPDGNSGLVRVEEGAGEWGFSFGRFVGTHPASGTVYDEPAIQLDAMVHRPSVEITGSAADLDRWLWGRGSLASLTVKGDQELAAVLRQAAAGSTQ